MTRTITLAALLVAAALTGCSSSEGTSSDSRSSAATAVAPDPGQYAEHIIEEFRETYALEQEAETDAEYVAVTADWAAFVTTIEALRPPQGEGADHNRMVSAFQAYVDARKKATTVCDESPGLGGPCFTASSAANDQWRATMDRAYELPGLSWNTLLG